MNDITTPEARMAARIAYRIRAELVCCDIYARDAYTGRAGQTHAICFWGEAAARIAEEEAARPSFTCPDCNRTSYHPEDVRNSYCGNCHAFKPEEQPDPS